VHLRFLYLSRPKVDVTGAASTPRAGEISRPQRCCQERVNDAPQHLQRILVRIGQPKVILKRAKQAVLIPCEGAHHPHHINTRLASLGLTIGPRRVGRRISTPHHVAETPIDSEVGEPVAENAARQFRSTGKKRQSAALPLEFIFVLSGCERIRGISGAVAVTAVVPSPGRGRWLSGSAVRLRGLPERAERPIVVCSK
jgi:hypothetical protein